MANILMPAGNVQSASAVGTIVYCILLVARAYGAKIPDEVVAALPGAAVVVTAYVHDVIERYLDHLQKETDDVLSCKRKSDIQ